jgi:murein DD-endopeptidase MepM/ murein hydrolase activator NlpD
MNPTRYKNLQAPGVVTTPFLGRTKDENPHKGVDFANKTGTPIPAFNEGDIVATGPTSNGQGNVVVLKDVNGDTHEYSHLQKPLVKPGMKVKKGQPIATMGATGNSYSPSGGDPSHLDIRIVSAYGRYKNPMTYLNSFK